MIRHVVKVIIQVDSYRQMDGVLVASHGAAELNMFNMFPLDGIEWLFHTA